MNSLERRTAKLNKESGSGQGKVRLRTMRRRVLVRILLTGSSVLLLAVLAFAMTAAWFTNVSRSSDLTFTVESWGFDEDRITVPEGPVSIAPGRSGVIPLRVNNSGSSSRVRLDVGVARGEDMPEKLRQRLYFCVDASRTVSGETVDRLYITDRENERQIYYLGPGAVLDIAEDYQTDQPIRWVWVYDLLGYYFLGTPGSPAEYLRPIEYGYDDAVFDPDTLELLAVGEQGRTEFLAELFARDGYAGSTVTPVTVGGKTYYKIQADENDQGVWAYLLTKDEILAGFEDDAHAAEWGRVSVNVHIIAYDMPAAQTAVADAAALTEALAAPEGGAVTLAEDVELAAPAAVNAGSTLVIDLDGHNLTYTGGGAAFTVPEGGSLTLLNGQLDLGGADTAVSSGGGDVTLSGVSMTNCATAVLLKDDETAGDSILRITDCTLTSEQSTVWVYANASTAADTRVYITDSTLVSTDFAALLTNGTNGGTEMVVQGSTLNGCWAGLYQPQADAYTVLRGSTVTGYTGAAVKGGTLVIENSVVAGTGAAQDPVPGGSGWTDTGDGVYVEANYNWSARVELRGEGTQVSSAYGYAVQLFGVEGKGPGRIMVYNGTYSGARGGAVSNGVGVFEIHGGSITAGSGVTDKRGDLEGGGAGG